tara:strand:- start:23 stop:1459 length:1437 start_codon:yes stop_codon:yes gene_type:complete
MLLKLIIIFLLILFIAFYNVTPNIMDSDVMLVILIVLLLSTILFFTRNEKINALKGQFLKHSNLVVLGLLIVHFQMYADFILGYTGMSDSFIWVNESIVIKSMTLATIGLLCFYLGFLSYNKDFKRNGGKRIKPQYEYISVKFLMYISTLVLLIYFATVNPKYIMGHYGAVQKGAIATYMSLLFNLLIFGVIIQSCRNLFARNKIPKNFIEYTRFMGFHLLLVLGIYLLSVLISGDRGPLITFGLCYISGYFFLTKRKLSFTKGVMLFSVGALIITILGVARSFDKNLDFNQKINNAVFHSENEENSILPSTKELAVSIRTLHYSVNYISQGNELLYGRFQYQHIMASLPFSYIFNALIFEDTSFKFKGPASFVTWIHQGDFRTYGIGTSAMVDFYLDFGLMGVIFGMFIFGFFIRFAEVNFYSYSYLNLFSHIFIIVYLCNAIYISRSSVLFGFRTVVWILILLLINKYIFNKKLTK